MLIGILDFLHRMLLRIVAKAICLRYVDMCALFPARHGHIKKAPQKSGVPFLSIDAFGAQRRPEALLAAKTVRKWFVA